ncbi:MAG: CpaF family protein [Polyangiaceae bacterium]|nr:CpaF family protein [Polyangiaceae bacterium]
MISRQTYERTLSQHLRAIAPLMADPSVSEIMINGPDEIFVERAGRLTLTDLSFPSSRALMAALSNIAQFAGRELSESVPILEAHLPDGSRVEAVLPPVSARGPTVAIRRFFKEGLTMERLLEFGALTPEACEFLAGLVDTKQNLLVAGGTGSGKTSLLNALSGLIPTGERVVVLEDAQELQLASEHVVQLEARPADAEGQGAVTIRDLFHATLRLRPDRIVVGEIRGPEALELIQAMTSGHGGCLSTIHASHPKDTLHRLETLALMSGVELPLAALRCQVSSAIDWIVQTGRQRDGGRGITHITEVQSCSSSGEYRLRDHFRREAGVLVAMKAQLECPEVGHD